MWCTWHLSLPGHRHSSLSHTAHFFLTERTSHSFVSEHKKKKPSKSQTCWLATWFIKMQYFILVSLLWVELAALFLAVLQVRHAAASPHRYPPSSHTQDRTLSQVSFLQVPQLRHSFCHFCYSSWANYRCRVKSPCPQTWAQMVTQTLFIGTSFAEPTSYIHLLTKFASGQRSLLPFFLVINKILSVQGDEIQYPTMSKWPKSR